MFVDPASKQADREIVMTESKLTQVLNQLHDNMTVDDEFLPQEAENLNLVSGSATKITQVRNTDAERRGPCINDDQDDTFN